ncbi:MAG: hypothetical protein COT85_01260 [Chlamydiae bacterium CG10_big_fil_rev_8_21_14_0_10_42_34]|nr:MAG: hypothetical protein COT85_01260 [Chlamydiae bacterium CG10_big_fil_rev_8_21_14_0_10_42_34]
MSTSKFPINSMFRERVPSPVYEEKKEEEEKKTPNSYPRPSSGTNTRFSTNTPVSTNTPERPICVTVRRSRDTVRTNNVATRVLKPAAPVTKEIEELSGNILCYIKAGFFDEALKLAKNRDSSDVTKALNYLSDPSTLTEETAEQVKEAFRHAINTNSHEFAYAYLQSNFAEGHSEEELGDFLCSSAKKNQFDIVKALLESPEATRFTADTLATVLGRLSSRLSNNTDRSVEEKLLGSIDKVFELSKQIQDENDPSYDLLQQRLTETLTLHTMRLEL